MLALIAVTLWVLAAHSVGVWIWALTFIVLGAFETLEPAVYFSVVSFTTLGFGDITLPVQWRILSGMSAANGLILFGLSTAFLIEFVSRLRHAQHQADGRGKKR
jgi:membrane protein implicated in regulation of membrane protease activity